MMLLDNSQIINKTNQTAAFNYVYNASVGDMISFQVDATQVSTGTGTIKLQQSLDNSTWFDVSGDTLIINGTVDALWTVSPITAVFYRVNYAPTTGGTNFRVQVMSGVFGTGS